MYQQGSIIVRNPYLCYYQCDYASIVIKLICFIFTTIGTICMYNGEGDNYYRRGFFQFMYIHNHLKYDVTQNIISSHNAISYLNWISTALLGHMVCICGSAFATHINMSQNLSMLGNFQHFWVTMGFCYRIQHFWV